MGAYAVEISDKMRHLVNVPGMSRIRSSACFKLDGEFLAKSIGEGWVAGTLTFTLGVSKHPHQYRRIGNGERGVVVFEYDTIYHGHQRMAARYDLAPHGFGRRLAWQCPSADCQRHVKTLYRPHGGAYFLCRHCW